MGLDMFLEVLRTFECFATKVAFVRFQGNMDTDVRGNVITFDCRGSAATPLASQVEIVGALATDMAFTDMVLIESVRYSSRPTICPYVESLWAGASFTTTGPLTGQILTSAIRSSCSRASIVLSDGL